MEKTKRKKQTKNPTRIASLLFKNTDVRVAINQLAQFKLLAVGEVSIACAED